MSCIRYWELIMNRFGKNRIKSLKLKKMNIDVNLIGNVLIAMFLYNIVVRAFAATVIKQIMKSDVAQEKKKTFREELKKKLKEDK